jgi:hypothetical protein
VKGSWSISVFPTVKDIALVNEKDIKMLLLNLLAKQNGKVLLSF